MATVVLWTYEISHGNWAFAITCYTQTITSLSKLRTLILIKGITNSSGKFTIQ